VKGGLRLLKEGQIISLPLKEVVQRFDRHVLVQEGDEEEMEKMKEQMMKKVEKKEKVKKEQKEMEKVEKKMMMYMEKKMENET